GAPVGAVDVSLTLDRVRCWTSIADRGPMATVEHPITPDDRSSELTASFSETAQALFSAGNPADTLRAVVDLAVETIDGCDFASIFVLDGNTLTTPVGTDSVAAGVDVVQ